MSKKLRMMKTQSRLLFLFLQFLLYGEVIGQGVDSTSNDIREATRKIELRDSGFFLYYEVRGDAYLSVGMLNEAINDYSHYLDYDRDLEVLFRRSYTYYLSKKYEDCLIDINEVLSREGNKNIYFYLQAEVNRLLENYKVSLILFDLLINNLPNGDLLIEAHKSREIIINGLSKKELDSIGYSIKNQSSPNE